MKNAGRSIVMRIGEPGHIAPYSSEAAVRHALARKIERCIEFEALQGEPVVHVKDGKPLTAHGAKMLGVEWPVR